MCFDTLLTKTNYELTQDPKTSKWLWDIRERVRQKKRTEHYREIMRMQQENANPLEQIDVEDKSAATTALLEKITKLADRRELENFLSYGRWSLDDADIERLQKDDEMRQRVSTFTLFLRLNFGSWTRDTFLIF